MKPRARGSKGTSEADRSMFAPCLCMNTMASHRVSETAEYVWTRTDYGRFLLFHLRSSLKLFSFLQRGGDRVSRFQDYDVGIGGATLWDEMATVFRNLHITYVRWKQ